MAGADDRGRIGHVLKHFKAGDHVELLWHFFGQRFGGDLAVIHFHAGLKLMQAGYGQWRLAHVDARHLGAALGHGFTENAAAAAHVEDFFAGQLHALVNPVDAQRVDVVQWLEFALTVPPAMGKRFEFGDLGVVNVAHGSIL